MSHDSYQMLGKSVLVRSTSPEFANQVRSLFRSFPFTAWDDGAAPDITFSVIVAAPPKSRTIRPYHFVYSNHLRTGRTTSYWRLFRFLEWQIDLFMGEAVKDSLLLHAGAVARNGTGIILPGESESGKSSLTTSLVTRGYSYLSDELAVIDPLTAKLSAFPKPLSIKDISVFPELAGRDDLWVGPPANEEADEAPVWYAHVEDIAPQPIADSVRVGYIIFPRYDSTTEPRLQPLSPSEAMRKAIENSINLRELGGAGLGVLGDVLRGAQAFSLTTNGLEATTTLIDELIAS